MLNTRVGLFRLSLVAALVTIPAMALMAGARPVSSAVELPAEVGAATTAAAATASAFDANSWEEDALGDIDPAVFATALHAAASAVGRGEANPATLTVIDFSRPSTEPRMWVYDLRSRTLLFDELVSHGRGSGRTMATTFSNDPESNQSSLGLYRAAETYVGKHGYSLRLDGLEKGINDRARERAIVMHAADYVNANTARANGYLGRSLGCPALRPEIARNVIDAVKGGGLVFAYYPDPHWLRTSTYLS